MGFPNFFDRIYLEIIEDPCYNTTGKQNKQLLWYTGIWDTNNGMYVWQIILL